ncbi:hypothetical protein A3J43_01235 [Candidatus Uhrbacteria bacterium RIFCSPHIGHO2_12_FULL_54_23]|uniref:Colicin V production protein n=3 Tax=Candidatus Uhriibacteriota TaxID=1752732 RepID=A0A1F7UJH3_9BACT|nr:MAG: hypothetical protein A3J43_01235 [Candidatus Uhrbacteria bacterium RIFCSPHIGHO2_12_FULL_54_23]OGL85636.1 MAG: hypothetical protein A3B36_01925 [Candidatus Uhrbacteria bacterium RIFCSPLOWO2_01_FULL_55_36]OGL90645.1 MAG: hypothetical protein A3J36_02660 [Candidatus Uhrbacteria bacterium RIFCSPLOWO2_02_FULL_54_37]
MGDFLINFGKSLGQLDLTTPSWDVFILLFFLVGVFLYGIALGRNRVILILLSLYFALALYEVSSLIRGIGAALLGGNPLTPLITFFVLFLATFFVVGQSGAAKSLASDQMGSFFQTIIFSVFQVGLTISVGMMLLPPEMQERFSPVLRQIFIEQYGQALWLILPILGLLITRSKGVGVQQT